MGDKLQNDTVFSGWRNAVMLFLLCAMMGSALFLPRAFLSSCMIFFIVVSFFHNQIKQQVGSFLKNPLLWGMSLLFFIPLLTGFWSEDQQEWLKSIRIKLPLLFMPLAFAAPFHFSNKYWNTLAIVFILLVVAATGWSMFHYLPEMKNVHEGYLRSNLVRTPMENDHVRFSWLVCIAIVTAGWIFWKNRKSSGFISLLIPVISIWLIVYLHILAARTGLLCFYTGLAIVMLWLIFKKANRMYSVILLVLFFALPFMAYLLLPTFQNRVKYFLYDLPYFSKAHYLENTNDAVRIISLKAGWNVMNENPVAGVGFGDVKQKTHEWYALHFPQMHEVDKILPSGQWMMYGAGAGWAGFIMAILIIFLPFAVKNIPEKLPWYILSASAAVLPAVVVEMAACELKNAGCVWLLFIFFKTLR
jgi:O-antigen ligase